jgi:hypothetical protein
LIQLLSKTRFLSALLESAEPLFALAWSLINSVGLISVRLLKNLHFTRAAIAAAMAALTQVIAAGVLGAIYAYIARGITANRTDESADFHLKLLLLYLRKPRAREAGSLLMIARQRCAS